MMRRALCAAMVLLVAGVSFAGAPGRAPVYRVAPWVFHADFEHGLTGWMSFPLVQDIGFDATLYTARQGPRTVLVRQVRTLGQKRLLMGVVRPFNFLAEPKMRVQLEYSFHAEGDLSSMQIILAAANGSRYSVALPREHGSHDVSVGGAQFKLPSGGTNIQAVVLLGTIEHPTRGGTQQLTLSDFTVHAGHRPHVALVLPVLEHAEAGDDSVSRQVLSQDSDLHLKIERSATSTHVELFNAAGRLTRQFATRSKANSVESISLGADPKPGLWTAKLINGSAETDFRFLVLGAMPRHPRILLRKHRLDQLRTLPEYAELRAQIHRRAKALAAQIAYNPAAGNNIAHLPVGRSFVPVFVGQVKSYFKLLESYANAISYCALDYSLNGNQKSFESAKRALLTVARWKTWTPPRFEEHGMHTYYEVGVFTQRVALGYDLIAPQLTEEEKELVANAFWKQIIMPTVHEYFLYNRMPTAASNWMANSLGGAIAAAVADEGDVPEWRSREGVALAELEDAFEHLLKGLFPGDGSEVEPAGYENFAMRGISWGVAALDSLEIHPRGTRRMWNGFWWPYYAMVRPDLVLDTGDFDGRLEKLSGFAWGAEHAGIPALRGFYDRSTTHLSFGAELEVKHTGRKIEDEAGPLDLACCSGPAQGFPPPPLARIFRDRGSAVMRSGWGNQSTVISLRNGPWFNHEHHDEGSFQVAAFGEKLVSEAGYSAYYNDPDYPVYFSQAPGHNTVLIDDNPFSQTAYNGTFWRAFDQYPHFTSHLLSPEFDYLATDLTSAYAGRLTSYNRDFVFIPPDFLVVYGHVASNAPHVYAWLLHAPSGAELSTKAAHAVIQTPGAAASLLAVAPVSDWNIKSTPIPITKFDDLDLGEIHTPREFYLRSSKVRAATFLVGLDFVRGRVSGAATLMRPFSSSAGKGIRRMGSIPCGVVFRTGRGGLQLNGLTTDGSMLAVMGEAAADSWMAAGARVMHRGKLMLFRSSVPLNVAMLHEGRRLELNLHVGSTTTIVVASSSPPSFVRMDGKPIHFVFRAGSVVIQGVKKGDHRVSIDE